MLDDSVNFEHNVEGIINPMQNDTLKIKWIQNTLNTLTGEIMLYHNDTTYVNPVIVHFKGTAGPAAFVKSSIKNKKKVLIYPNPVSGTQFSIRMENAEKGEAVIHVFDINGNTAYSETISIIENKFTTEIKFKNILEQGVYFVNIKYEDGTESINKIIIK